MRVYNLDALEPIGQKLNLLGAWTRLDPLRHQDRIRVDDLIRNTRQRLGGGALSGTDAVQAIQLIAGIRGEGGTDAERAKTGDLLAEVKFQTFIDIFELKLFLRC